MTFLWPIVPIAVVVGCVFNHRRLARATETAYAIRFAPDTEGVASGAGTFMLQGKSGRGVLMLHGSGDTPQSLRYLGEKLHTAGYTVFAPLLPGHGRSPKEFARATALQYQHAAQRALEELRGQCTSLAVLGLSMGGALATHLVVEAPDVRVLVLLAPYFAAPPAVVWARRTAWLWGLASPYIRGGGEASVHDTEAGAASRAYGTFSAGALDALVATADLGRRALSSVTMPTLVINSEQDNRVSRQVALGALELIRAPVEQHWVAGCGHVITVDYCKDEVAKLVIAFLARHT